LAEQRLLLRLLPQEPQEPQQQEPQEYHDPLRRNILFV
jgi:hypothetical protein